MLFRGEGSPASHKQDKPEFLTWEDLKTKKGFERLKILAQRQFGRQLQEDQIEEIAEHVWHKALANQEKFIGERLMPWLVVVLRNTGVNYLKKVGRRKEVSAVKENAEGEERNIYERTSSGESDQEDWEARETLRRRFSELSESQKEVIKLRMDGLTYEEIAEKLQKPLGTVRGRGLAAMKILRGEYED